MAKTKDLKKKTMESRSQPMSQAKKAGLVFPVGRLKRLLKKGRYAQRIGGGAPVFLAGVLEYLVAELLELAGNAALEMKKQRITPRHILLAVRNDDEFNDLFQGIHISAGGVVAQIHKSLLPKKTGGNSMSSSDNSTN